MGPFVLSVWYWFGIGLVLFLRAGFREAIGLRRGNKRSSGFCVLGLARFGGPLSIFPLSRSVSGTG